MILDVFDEHDLACTDHDRARFKNRRKLLRHRRKETYKAAVRSIAKKKYPIALKHIMRLRRQTPLYKYLKSKSCPPYSEIKVSYKYGKKLKQETYDGPGDYQFHGHLDYPLLLGLPLWLNWGSADPGGIAQQNWFNLARGRGPSERTGAGYFIHRFTFRFFLQMDWSQSWIPPRLANFPKKNLAMDLWRVQVWLDQYGSDDDPNTDIWNHFTTRIITSFPNLSTGGFMLLGERTGVFRPRYVYNYDESGFQRKFEQNITLTRVYEIDCQFRKPISLRSTGNSIYDADGSLTNRLRILLSGTDHNLCHQFLITQRSGISLISASRMVFSDH